MATTLAFPNLPVGPTLAELGFETLDLFQQVQSTDIPGAVEEWPAESFADEAERFELWAVNLGLFVGGHGSLDYRVREADKLAQTIKRFMKELNDSLAEVIEIRAGSIDGEEPDEGDGEGPEGEQGDPDSLARDEDPARREADNEADEDDVDDDETDESDLDILVDDVRDSIDRLYKVSTKIRSPSSRLGSSRAAKHQQIDEDTGVDFLKVVEQADCEHIRALFLQYQISRVLQEHEPSEPKDSAYGTEEDDGVWEPIRSTLAESQNNNSFLIGRLGHANVRRRQQFAYWKKHRDKLLHHARASISSQSAMTPRDETPSRPSAGRHLSSDMTPPVMSELAPPMLVAPSVTTATNLNAAKFETMETRSTISVSEYAVSTWQPARDAVAFPPPPRDQSGDKFFECPYCFTFCPRGTLADKAWKAHMIHDLRPYICTYEDCKNPDQLYDNRQDWEQHENSCHRKVWRCPEHTELVYTQLDAYRDHLRVEHGETGDDASVSRIVRASESTLSITDRPCPICSVVLETPRAMQSHIALHLERFSLFSLPRSVVCADDEVSDAGSDVANGTLEASRDDDFEGDLENLGSEEGDEEGEKKDPAEAPQTDGDKIADATSKETVNAPEIRVQLTEDAIQKLNTQVGKPENDKDSAPTASLSVTATTIKIFEEHDTPVYMMVFSPDEKQLVSVSDDRVVRFWDLEDGKPLPSFEGHKKGFRSVAWSPDGNTIASGSYDKTIKLWDVATGACLHTLTGHNGAIAGLGFTSDSKTLASASHDKLVKVWDVATGTERFTLRGHTVGNFSLGISPDDKYIVSGSNDKTAKIWNQFTGELIRTIKGHRRVVYAVGFGKNGILATGSNDWSIKLWNLESGELLRTLKGHEQGVTSLAFSPDQSLMASGAYDDKVRIWDTNTWETVCVLEGHSGHVYGVAFSRDGRRLASGSRDRTVRLWDLAIEKKAAAEEPAQSAAQWSASVPVIVTE